MRRSYFARAGLVARRYGVAFEQVITHLWRVRRRRGRISIRAVKYLDDLVHAVACCHEVAVAWSDLTDLHERPLVRRCRVQLDATASIVAVRRMFAELRRSETLLAYDGRTPLRAWLSDELMELVARDRFAGWPTELPPFQPESPIDVVGRVPAAIGSPGPAVSCHLAARRF